MNTKSKYLGKGSPRVKELREITSYLDSFNESTKRLKHLASYIYIILMGSLLIMIMYLFSFLFHYRFSLSLYPVYLVTILVLSYLMSFFGIFYIRKFDKIKRHEMIKYEIFIDFLEKKVKHSELFEGNLPLEIRKTLKEFLDSCNLIFTNSDIGVFLYLLIFILFIFFNSLIFFNFVTMF